ncbi:MAG: hypothetical protein ACLPSO_14130 [Terracidiphilus sp.]
MADNCGELLFELCGATQRQFVLYRILRGQTEKPFVTGGGNFSTESRESVSLAKPAILPNKSIGESFKRGAP